MPATLQVELADGRTVYFGGTGKDAAGLREVSVGESVAEASAAALERGLAGLRDVVAMLDRSVAGLVKKPEKVEVEFAAKLTGKANLWVVSGDASAEFKVKLTWGK
ncbi:CU044_2847 family protein [Roseomonas fluvialis]|uniref:Trypsin-co-occurring domain-containing protein n=1 Tax=Roseomonas fluvialis TaxID=1750527 RepID=A0ABN6P3L8_9PROT|nr:CU044_2847 family protein [Roseomonas fluvialis]BDG73247.1 hypothetical protein Rmf_31760 [Roseomonas fluvialis]